MKGRGSSSPLHPNNKWNALHQYIKERRIAILAVQETHLDDDHVERLSEVYGRRLAIYASHSDSATTKQGVALVVNRDLVNINDIEATEIIPGRAILIEIPWHEDTKLRILNVYGPNDSLENATFWGKIEDHWRENDTPRPDAILGDFNVIEDPIDRLPQRRDDLHAVEALQRLMKYMRLWDGWRENNLNERDFSFPVVQKNSKSRIDRIYVTKKILKMAEEWTIEISQINTDHRMVTTQITNAKAPFMGPGRWSMPTDLLTDKDFMKNATARTVKLKDDVRNSLKVRTVADNPQVHFYKYKREVIELARERLKTKVPKVRKALEKLTKDLEELKKNPSSHSSESLQLTMHLIETRITQLQMMSNQAKRLATTARYRLEGETISKYWTSINKGKSPRDLIYSLAKPDTLPPTYERRSDRMANLARDYHENLQTHDNPGDQHRAQSIATVCNAVETTYDDCAPNTLSDPINEKEVLKALKASENGKATGVNGIPYEFWKTLSAPYEEEHAFEKEPLSAIEREAANDMDIIWILTKVFRDVETFGIAPTTDFALGWMCPIYKCKGDRRAIANYRPITLLNTDYKILTKVLALKLAEVAPTLINDDQAGFVPGRQIFNQIRQAQLVIDYAEAVEVNGVIIALDQEKAYDKVMHDYLWKVMDAIRIPTRFTKMVKNLYADANTVVMINGERSKPFRVTRGVRQGCPLSCLIFDLAIEPLACMLRQSPLEGINIPGLTDRIVASLFADDTTIYMSERDSMNNLNKVLDTWTEASGGKFNPTKMKVIPIGSPTYRDQVREKRAPNQTSDRFPEKVEVLEEGNTIRILGAWIGNHPDPAVSWKTTLTKMSSSLDQWAKCHPSLNGRRLIVQMVIGGMTQFLAKAQGMPPEVEQQVTTLIRDFVWDGAKKPMVNIETLYLPHNLGGIKLLDIRARNHAIHLVWMREYLNLTKERPNWAYIADALIALAIKQKDGGVDGKAKINTFIQSWEINLHSQKTLPRELRQMLTVGKKYGIRLDTLKLPLPLKQNLPIWFHIGAEQKLHSLTKGKQSRCLRKTHGVTTVGDTLRMASRMNHQQPTNADRQKGHLKRKNCACPPCSVDRKNGCENPSKCCIAAETLVALLYPKYAPHMAPPVDGLSLTPRRKKANTLALEKDEKIVFDPSITDPEDVSQSVRVFTTARTDISCRLPSLRPRQQRRSDEELTVYTDGASLKNGDEDSRVGSGVWFGPDDPRNASIRVGRKGATNQTGELIAVLIALQKAPPDVNLHIKSDSKYVINGLTKHLPKWQDNGWIDVSNADIFQSLVTHLRQRSAPTTFQWVKGHADILGNEQADKLAGDGALKDECDTIHANINPSFLLNGAKLAAMTQALAYKGIRLVAPLKPRQRTTQILQDTQEAVKRNTTRLRPLSAIWNAVRSKDIARPIQDFIWKGLHGAHKVGTYWSYIPECEDRILCRVCGEEDSLRHILCECEAPGQKLAWKLAERLWRRKHKSWKPITLEAILSTGAMGHGENGLPTKGGTDRLHRIIITETAYLIWKIRCERVIQRENDPAEFHSSIEIAHRWMAVMNLRLTLDRQMTRKSLSSKAIKGSIVKSTWHKVIENEDSLPKNWLKAKEVLVGSVDQEVLLDLDIDESHTTG